MVLTRFLPRDEQFYGHFRDGAANAVEMANLLVEIFNGGDEVERKVRRLRDLEHRGDEITHRVFSALNATFVTPMDREDIDGLASEIDDFADNMEEAGRRLWLYRLTDPTDSSRFLARIIAEQSGLILEAMGLLEEVGKHQNELKRLVVEVHSLENEGDDRLNQALASLYDGVTEVPALIHAIHWGEIYGLLEDATDRAEDIANRVEGIVAKYG